MIATTLFDHFVLSFIPELPVLSWYCYFLKLNHTIQTLWMLLLHGRRWSVEFVWLFGFVLFFSRRGLSNHYIGKSKSFGNLMGMEVSNTKDLEKVESPLNKRRRLLIANKLRRRSLSSSFSFYPKTNLNSMPLLALQESDEDDHKYNNDDDDDDSSDEEINKLQDKRMKMTNNRDFMVQTQSCFCLSSFPDDDR